MADVVKLGSKGELQLPKHVRAELGLKEGDQLVLEITDEAIVLKRKARRFAAYLDSLGRVFNNRERS
ncbi:MAG TPA: AbrB/MazE/SpoVT family DNA-binding domain-containing protein [Candidatus Acidoferrales bacterium]|nr:AbrB/MazE/SpoVT family DNA-binding domain-containing protein [Candidatus Acidoferrales bacterium]